MEEGKKKHGLKNSEDMTENVKDDTQEKQSSKKKGKGKKGKKGKGRGKKSNRETSEMDKTALKEFIDNLKGTRRLMVRNFSFCFCNQQHFTSMQTLDLDKYLMCTILPLMCMMYIYL